MNKYLTIGAILKSKPQFGGGFYAEIKNPRNKEGELVFKDSISFPLTITEGTRLFLDDPRERLDFLVSEGKMSQDEANEKKAKIPSFKKYDIKMKVGE